MEIHNWEDGPQGGNIFGVFTVYIPALGLSLHKVKAVKTKKGGVFIAFPSFSKEDNLGQKTWYPYFSFSEARSKDFQIACLEAIEPFLTPKQTSFL